MKKTGLICALLLAGCQGAATVDTAASALAVARFNGDGALERPDVTRWVHMGSSIGRGYAQEITGAPDGPGTIQVVQMEPAAYDYFMTHGEYAEGTMFSLSFYAVQEKPEPRLDGFAQENLVQFEIHMLDSTRFSDQRGFFLFAPDSRIAPMMPAGNACVVCHNAEGAYDGTFTQFYPPLRDFVPVVADAD